MDSTAVVAVTSVLVSGLLAPILSSRISKGQRQAERTDLRVEQAHDLIDETISLSVQTWFAGSAIKRLWRHGEDPLAPHSVGARTVFGETRGAFSVARVRLAARFGPDHPIVKAAEDLDGPFDELREFLEGFALGLPNDTVDSDLLDIYPRYRDCRRALILAARDIIGVNAKGTRVFGEAA